MRPGGSAVKAPDVPGLRRVSAGVIYGHVFGNADREVGGVLVGRIPREGQLPMVSGAIEAIKADEQRATLTFTQDAWEHVHRTLDETYPEGTQIVGWYHSHPGFGIFLSEHDLFIHRNFFSGVSQIAVVVDPVAQTEGVFVWRDGQIEPLFERPTPRGWQAQGADVRPRRGRTEVMAGEAPDARYPVLALVAAALIGLLVGLGAWSLVDGGTEQQPAVLPPAQSDQRPQDPARGGAAQPGTPENGGRPRRDRDAPPQDRATPGGAAPADDVPTDRAPAEDTPAAPTQEDPEAVEQANKICDSLKPGQEAEVNGQTIKRFPAGHCTFTVKP